MRKVRPESRRWIAPQVLGSPFRMPIDPLSAFVPFVPLPDTQRSAWAILCPTGCTTELIILPEHAGQWVECPTCGFRFLGPHPAQPKMVAEARARTARVAAEDAKMAGVLAALAKVDPQPKPPVAAKPDKPKAAKPQAKIPGKSPPLPESDEILFAKPVSGQVQVMDVLEMLADASREAAAPPPAARRPRIMLLKARPAPKPPAQQEAKAASALDELEKKCHRPAGRQPVVPEPPRRASAPDARRNVGHRCDGGLGRGHHSGQESPGPGGSRDTCGGGQAGCGEEVARPRGAKARYECSAAPEEESCDEAPRAGGDADCRTCDFAGARARRAQRSGLDVGGIACHCRGDRGDGVRLRSARPGAGRGPLRGPGGDSDLEGSTAEPGRRDVVLGCERAGQRKRKGGKATGLPSFDFLVEAKGFEPMTSWMPSRRSPN
jgi:hypothetical protein